MEGVELEFEDEALEAVVKKAITKGTGARALRSILEEIMIEIMYKLPGRENVSRCVITKNVINKTDQPVYIQESGSKYA